MTGVDVHRLGLGPPVDDAVSDRIDDVNGFDIVESLGRGGLDELDDAFKDAFIYFSA